MTLLAQTITFAKPPTQGLPTGAYNTNASASSALPVTLTSTTPGVCFASDVYLFFMTTGTCTITATQSGNAGYDAAIPVTRSFSIVLGSQTITFPKPANQSMASPSLVVAPTASSGLPVTLTSTTIGTCTVTDFTISFVTGGTCSLTARSPATAPTRPRCPFRARSQSPRSRRPSPSPSPRTPL